MSEKLIRDKIPLIIMSKGEMVSFREAKGDEEFLQFLYAKLGEEYYEYVERGDLGELADMLEVIRALCSFFGTSPQELIKFYKPNRALSFSRKVLYEELQEVMYAFIKEKRLDKLSDMLDIMHALSIVSESSMEYVEYLADRKVKARGGFEKRYIFASEF